jgi:hypothetical protein
MPATRQLLQIYIEEVKPRDEYGTYEILEEQAEDYALEFPPALALHQTFYLIINNGMYYQLQFGLTTVCVLL